MPTSQLAKLPEEQSAEGDGGYQSGEVVLFTPYCAAEPPCLAASHCYMRNLAGSSTDYLEDVHPETTVSR